MKQKSLKDLFIEIAQPDDQGYSKEIPISDLITIDPRFATNNGGHWCRSDGPLGRQYHIIRTKEKGKIVSVKLDGYNRQPTIKKINPKISVQIKSQKCVILQIGTNIECDHKNAKYNEREMEDISEQKLQDFQPLSKAANDAKRQHCKVCRETGHRFDAKILGYSQSYIKGASTSYNCEGCYWYDPFDFNRQISSNFIKEK